MSARSDRNISVPIGTFLFRFGTQFGISGLATGNIQCGMGNWDGHRGSAAEDGRDGQREGVRAAGGVLAGENRPAAHTDRGRRPGWAFAADANVEGGVRGRRPDTRSATLDREALEILIVQQWTKMLKDPYDWAEWPLARYTLSADVVSSVRGASSATVHCSHPGALRLAWVCAMVACGRAPRLRSLDPAPLVDAAGEELVRDDGARGWRCNVKRDTPEGPQLRYWIHPTGLVEFDAICGREQLCLA